MHMLCKRRRAGFCRVSANGHARRAQSEPINQIDLYAAVRAAYQENLDTCLDGRVPAFCNDDLLTEYDVARVRAAEYEANLVTCIDPRWQYLCRPDLLPDSEICQPPRPGQERPRQRGTRNRTGAGAQPGAASVLRSRERSDHGATPFSRASFSSSQKPLAGIMHRWRWTAFHGNEPVCARQPAKIRAALPAPTVIGGRGMARRRSRRRSSALTGLPGRKWCAPVVWRPSGPWHS